MGRVRRAGSRDARVRALAQWWTQATDKARFGLLQRLLDKRSPPQKEDPTLEELHLSIYLAESSAGETEGG
jgi:hypothetical protein